MHRGVGHATTNQGGASDRGRVGLLAQRLRGFFAAEGAFVAVVDLNEAGARSISTEIGNAASAIRCDVAVGPEVRNAVETTQKIFGRLDIVVNNAGTTHRNKPMLEVTEAEFDKVYAVNVKSIFHMALAAVPVMRRLRAVAFFSISVRRLAYGRVQDLLGTTDRKAP